MFMMGVTSGLTAICLLFGAYLFFTAKTKRGINAARCVGAFGVVWIGLMFWVIMFAGFVNHLITRA